VATRPRDRSARSPAPAPAPGRALPEGSADPSVDRGGGWSPGGRTPPGAVDPEHSPYGDSEQLRGNALG